MPQGKRTVEERFLSKVNKTDACWLWLGAIDRDGYGRFDRPHDSWGGSAYRFAYEHWVGPLIKGMSIDHLCRVRACVNPAHLEQVSGPINKQRGLPSLLTYCTHGHPFDEANTYWRRTGGRGCRTCHRDSARERMRRMRAQG
jgi:hypothetical protein